jgi:CubicO group peptidase (beta-lactamase class C family)
VQPQTEFMYSVGPDIQARLVESLSGLPFDEYLKRHLFGPLKMKDADFYVPPGKADRLATVYWSKEGALTPLDATHGHPDGGVLVQPESVNSYLSKPARTGGSFGLVGTVQDYWRFAQMMANGGELDGARILSPAVVQYMTRDHLGSIAMLDSEGRPAGTGFGLGFAVMLDDARSGYMSPRGAYFWAGAAATYFWVDPAHDLVVVAMTQHMGVPALDSLWAQLRTLIYSALLN